MAHQNIPQTLGADIRTAIAGLDSIRTAETRDAIVWAQMVLTACATMIGEPAFEIKCKSNETAA